MNILVIAEHDHASIHVTTRHAVMAAAQIVMFTDAQVHLVVIGHEAEQAAQAGVHIAGVAQVIHFYGAECAKSLAEDAAAQLHAIAANYSHILFAATARGRLIAQRLAEELGVTLINEIVSIESADTFQHATDAGHEMATVQSTDAIKILTVRTTRFEAVPATGGSATVEIVAPAAPGSYTTLAGSAIVKSGRPAHPAAREASCAGGDDPLLYGHYGPLWRESVAGGHEANQFDRGDPPWSRGPDLHGGPTRSLSEPSRGAARARRGALDFANPGV